MHKTRAHLKNRSLRFGGGARSSASLLLLKIPRVFLVVAPSIRPRRARRLSVRILEMGSLAGCLGVLLVSSVAMATDDASGERVTLEAAVQRAMAKNPNAAIAAAEIQRAEALVEQAR